MEERNYNRCKLNILFSISIDILKIAYVEVKSSCFIKFLTGKIYLCEFLLSISIICCK